MSQGSTTQRTLLPGFVSTGNSTTTPLGSAGVFTGAAEEILAFASIGVFVFADQASAVDGLSVEHSSNGTNWDDTDTYTIVANKGRFFNFPPEARYLRVKYTNGAIAQTAFRLQTILHTSRIKPSSHRITDAISDEEDAELTIALVKGRKPDGTYANAKLDANAQLVVVSSSAVATTKGFADGKIVLSAATVTPVRATVYLEQTSNAQRSILSSSILDTAAGTGARTWRLTYYSLFAGVITGPFTETGSFNGVTAVNTVATNICFIEDIHVLTAGATGSNAGLISLFAAAGGAGALVWSVAINDNETYGAHHYVANGKTANVTGFVGSIKGADTSGFFLRSVNPTVSDSADIQVSDQLRVPTGAQSNRTYGTPIAIVGPARITAYAVPDTASTRTYYASFDFYEE